MGFVEEHLYFLSLDPLGILLYPIPLIGDVLKELYSKGFLLNSFLSLCPAKRSTQDLAMYRGLTWVQIVNGIFGKGSIQRVHFLLQSFI